MAAQKRTKPMFDLDLMGKRAEEDVIELKTAEDDLERGSSGKH